MRKAKPWECPSCTTQLEQPDITMLPDDTVRCPYCAELLVLEDLAGLRAYVKSHWSKKDCEYYTRFEVDFEDTH